MAASSRIRAARPVCVLFGPQSSAVDESLSLIRNALQAKQSLNFLEPVLEELPSLWPVITAACPALSRVPGAAELETLAQLARGEPLRSIEKPMNVLLTPVTVLRHIVEFLAVKENAEEYRIVDAQGFCVGFLAAVAVSCSQNPSDFRKAVSVMVRLAVCIGAAVDLDALVNGPTRSIAVRWKSGSENKKLNHILLSSATVRMTVIGLPRGCDVHRELTVTTEGLYFMLHRYKLGYNHGSRCRGG